MTKWILGAALFLGACGSSATEEPRAAGQSAFSEDKYLLLVEAARTFADRGVERQLSLDPASGRYVFTLPDAEGGAGIARGTYRVISGLGGFYKYLSLQETWASGGLQSGSTTLDLPIRLESGADGQEYPALDMAEAELLPTSRL